MLHFIVQAFFAVAKRNFIDFAVFLKNFSMGERKKVTTRQIAVQKPKKTGRKSRPMVISQRRPPSNNPTL
jgi:hypothetical protein